MVEFSLHAWDSTSRTSPLWALFAPLNDVENGECAFVFNSIFHHICGCHAVWLLYLVTTLIKLAFVTRYTRYTLFPTLKALRGGIRGTQPQVSPNDFFATFFVT